MPRSRPRDFLIREAWTPAPILLVSPTLVMSRWLWFFILALLGLALLLGGWLVPAHLRAVDIGVLRLAGQRSPTLVEQGLTLVSHKNLGAARLLLAAAETNRVAGRDKLAVAVNGLARENPRLEMLGTPEPRLGSLGSLVRSAADRELKPEPFTVFVLRLEHRDKMLELLRQSQRPAVQELLRTRSLTNTVVFSPSRSSSGQAFDAAIAVTGLLLDGGQLTSGLSEAVAEVAFKANHGGNTQPLEQALLDVLSLGQRLNWGQLVAFIGQIQDAETLRLLANVVRKDQDYLPTIFAAVTMSGKPAAVTHYAMEFSQTGVQDLGTALNYGTGALNELLARGYRIYQPSVRLEAAKYDPFGAVYYYALSYCLVMPMFALVAKWVLYVLGGFLFAASLHYGRGAIPELERPLQVRGFHFAREFLFGLGLLVAMLLLTEPFLAQESQRIEFPFKLRLPTVGFAAGTAVTTPANSQFMNQLSLLTLLLFFVLQGLIYVACLVKLSEIRRQSIPARIKLRLLENEDHLFDAGLYLGFVGTIISLILVSLGVIKPSLMAAYSSTSFGIIFVSVFKIFHLRPLRRKLVLESEATYSESPAVAPAASRS